MLIVRVRVAIVMMVIEGIELQKLEQRLKLVVS